MAKAARKRKAKAAVPPEGELTKGELRKLNALRKSIGDELGEEAFAKWLQEHRAGGGGTAVDRNAEMIADELGKLIETKNLRIQRGGYLITRGRGRVIVAPVEKEPKAKRTKKAKQSPQAA